MVLLNYCRHSLRWCLLWILISAMMMTRKNSCKNSASNRRSLNWTSNDAAQAHRNAGGWRRGDGGQWQRRRQQEWAGKRGKAKLANLNGSSWKKQNHIFVPFLKFQILLRGARVNAFKNQNQKYASSSDTKWQCRYSKKWTLTVNNTRLVFQIDNQKQILISQIHRGGVAQTQQQLVKVVTYIV